jgi:hypothetical protein
MRRLAEAIQAPASTHGARPSTVRLLSGWRASRCFFNRMDISPGRAQPMLRVGSPCARTHTEMTLGLHTIRARLCVGLTATLFASTVPAASEEIGHGQFHDGHYRHWKQPGTDESCCSDQDCAPVAAEWRNGRWFARRQAEWFVPPDWMGPGEWLPLSRSEWIAIPDNTILRVPNPTVEGAHLCYRSGAVVCFVPPNTGG